MRAAFRLSTIVVKHCKNNTHLLLQLVQYGPNSASLLRALSDVDQQGVITVVTGGIAAYGALLKPNVIQYHQKSLGKSSRRLSRCLFIDMAYVDDGRSFIAQVSARYPDCVRVRYGAPHIWTCAA